MKTTTIVAAILGVLVVISVVQAFQLNGLKEKALDGPVGSSLRSDGDARGSARTASLPSSIQNLPQMVGGC